jgi:NADPH2:quinone reductase
MQAIVVRETGGPEVLRIERAPDPEPGRGEVRVRVAAAGVNYLDVYHRTGLYPMARPFIPGSEAAGVVDAVGPDVREARAGDRVVWASHPGAYASTAIVPAWKLVHLPDGVDLQLAAAVMLQGMTAHYLAHDTWPLRAGEVALVHAAAGGVGLLLVQMAKETGAHVIGTTSTAAKAALVREAGAEHVLLYDEGDIATRVRALTDGRGADVVYDSVGRTTFAASLDALRPRGMLVLFGQSSGPVEPLDPGILARKGSLFLTRPTLAHYTATPDELHARARDVLERVASGRLSVRIDSVFPLEEAAAAHRRLESRATSGKVLLIVV